MIPRYTLPEMAALFTEEAKFSTWLEVEILAVEAWSAIGVIPPEDAAAVRERAGFTVEAIEERERTTDHDVAAFVDVVSAQVGQPAGAVGPLRPHVLGRHRHRPRPHPHPRRGPAPRRRRGAGSGHHRPGA